MSNETKKRVSDIAEAIEPYDKVWGVGASGFVVDPSPFERINLILDDTEKTTNGEVFAERAVILTEARRHIKVSPTSSPWHTAWPTGSASVPSSSIPTN